MENKQEKIEMQRHSMSHVLAKAVAKLFPGVVMGIGPAIENGFYYDFDLNGKLTSADFSNIEKEMRKILNANEPFERIELSREDALKLFASQPLKIELINDLPENETISAYKLGDDFVDLCRGPHVANSSQLQNFAFSLDRVNGAYWRGSEKNKMLARIYVYAFSNKKELDEYKAKIEEAKLRDHNKIGRELQYFTTVDYIGQGLPILLPKGAKVIQLLERFVEDEEEKRGYLLTKTPYLAKSDLYKISGHWQHYRENMFILGEETKDKEVFALRPMTCPFQFQAYLVQARSYRDLPMRLNETSTLFRNESSGEMHGLIRVRQFTISEGHIACLPSQLEEEFKGCVELANYMIDVLGFADDIKYRFSKWDSSNKDKYIGSAEEWENVQNRMREILNNLKIEYEEVDGEAAFYGPKLDIQMKNVHGKEDTIITVQIDFQLAERFGMSYTDEKGEKKFPYVIHRTSIGCYERTLALLLEKYAGALPAWISPTQIIVAPISEAFNEYAKEITAKLKALGFRTELDSRNEKIGYKIREGQVNKVPFMVILGEEEQKNKSVSVRMRGNQNANGISLEDFAKIVSEKVASKR
ncbi:MAG: threonine--tRNA ligase [Clostridia bacterium]